jgi:hypothetical protein
MMGKYETEKKACDICGGTNVKELYRSKKDGTAPVIEDGNALCVWTVVSFISTPP